MEEAMTRAAECSEEQQLSPSQHQYSTSNEIKEQKATGENEGTEKHDGSKNEIDLSSCRLENYLLPQHSPVVIDNDVNVYKINSPTAQKNVEFIQKTEKLLRSAVKEISQLELDIPKLHNELADVNYAYDDCSDNDSLNGLHPSFSSTYLMSDPFVAKQSSSNVKGPETHQVSKKKIMNKSSVSCDRLHGHKENQICEECLSPRKTVSRIQPCNVNKQIKNVTIKDDITFNKYLPVRNDECSCFLASGCDCKKQSKFNQFQLRSHSFCEKVQELKSFAQGNYNQSSSIDVNNEINNDKNHMTLVTQEKANRGEEKFRKIGLSKSEMSKNTVGQKIIKLSGVSDSYECNTSNNKRDTETNTEKGVPYRNLPNTSIINIKTQGTTTRDESDEETDLLSLLGKNLIKQNLPGVNIKPALSKQHGPTIHIPSGSKFAIKKERNKNVCFKEFVHESCTKADNRDRGNEDEFENCQNNISSTTRKNYVLRSEEDGELCSTRVENVKINSAKDDDIDINKIQERLRNVVKFYTEKLQSYEKKKFTYSHQQLIKTLNNLNDSITKLYDNQMSQYIRCGQNVPVKPPLSYRMKTVSDLLWGELDVRSHPTDEHCVQIDEILQYLVEDIKNVILKKTIINKSNPKNGDGPPQKDCDTITVDTSLRRLQQQTDKRQIQHLYYKNDKILRKKPNLKNHKIIPASEISKTKSEVNLSSIKSYSAIKKQLPSKVILQNKLTQKQSQHQISPTERKLSSQKVDVSRLASSSQMHYKANVNKVTRDTSSIKSYKNIPYTQKEESLLNGILKKAASDNFSDKHLVPSSDYIQKEMEDLEKLKRINRIFKINRNLHTLSEDDINARFPQACDEIIVKESVESNNRTELDEDTVNEDLQIVRIADHADSKSKITEEPEKCLTGSNKETSKRQVETDELSSKIISIEREQKAVVHEAEVHQPPQSNENSYEDDWESEGNEGKDDEIPECVIPEASINKGEASSSSTSVASDILDNDNRDDSENKCIFQETNEAKNIDDINESGKKSESDDFEDENDKKDDCIAAENSEGENNEIDNKIEVKIHEDSGEKGSSLELPEDVEKGTEGEITNHSLSDHEKKISFPKEQVDFQTDSVNIIKSKSDDKISVPSQSKKSGIKESIEGNINESKLDENTSVHSDDLESIIKDLSASVLDEISKSERVKEIENLKESIRSTSEKLNALLPEYINQSTNTSENISNSKITENVGTQIEDEFTFKISPETNYDENKFLPPFDLKKKHGSHLNRLIPVINSDTCTDNSASSIKYYDADHNLNGKSDDIDRGKKENKPLTSVHFSFPDSELNTTNAITMMSNAESQEIKITFDVNRNSRSYSSLEENQLNKKSSNFENAVGIHLGSPRRIADDLKFNSHKINSIAELNVPSSKLPTPRICSQNLMSENYGKEAQSNERIDKENLKNVIEKTVKEVIVKYKPYERKLWKDYFSTPEDDERVVKMTSCKSEEVQTDFDLIKPSDKLELSELSVVVPAIKFNDVETQTNESCENTKHISSEKLTDDFQKRRNKPEELFNLPNISSSKDLSHRNKKTTNRNSATSSGSHITSSFSSSSTSFHKSLAIARSTSTATSSDDQLSEGEINFGSSSCSCSFGEIKMWGCNNCGPYGVRKTSNRRNTNRNRFTWSQEFGYSKDSECEQEMKDLKSNRLYNKSSHASNFNDVLHPREDSKIGSIRDRIRDTDGYKSSINQRVVIGCEKNKDSNNTNNAYVINGEKVNNHLNTSSPSFKTEKSQLKLLSKSNKFSEVVKRVLQDLHSENSSNSCSNHNEGLPNNIFENKVTGDSTFKKLYDVTHDTTTNGKQVQTSEISLFVEPSTNKSQQQYTHKENAIYHTLMEKNGLYAELNLDTQKLPNASEGNVNLNSDQHCSNSTNDLTNHTLINSNHFKTRNCVQENSNLCETNFEHFKLIRSSISSDKFDKRLSSPRSNLVNDSNSPVNLDEHLLFSQSSEKQTENPYTKNKFQSTISSRFTSKDDNELKNLEENDSSSSGESLNNLLLESMGQDSSSDDLPSAAALDFFLANSSSDGECSEGQLFLIREAKKTK